MSLTVCSVNISRSWSVYIINSHVCRHWTWVSRWRVSDNTHTFTPDLPPVRWVRAPRDYREKLSEVHVGSGAPEEEKKKVKINDPLDFIDHQRWPGNSLITPEWENPHQQKTPSLSLQVQRATSFICSDLWLPPKINPACTHTHTHTHTLHISETW